MNKVAIVIGLLLVAVGLIGYFGAPPPATTAAEKTAGAAEGTPPPAGAPAATASEKSKSKTPLIPAVFGILILMCGTLALEARWRKQAMHFGVGIALIGGLMTAVMFATRIPRILSATRRPISARPRSSASWRSA